MSFPTRHLLIALVSLACLTLGSSADLTIPECTKEDVRLILAAQDWTHVNVIAVINGLNREKIAAPSLCHTLALAWRDGRWQDLRVDLYYDRDLGWFTYESSPELFRLWNRAGYQEIKPEFWKK